MDEEIFVISPKLKGGLGRDEVISRSGFVSTHVGKELGVQRRNGIVYKEVLSLADAQRSMEIYRRLKKGRVPVVSFAKIIKKREDGQEAYYMAMEDLTEGDQFRIIEIPELQSRHENISLNGNMQLALVQAMACVHNLGIVDIHPGLSIALRIDKETEEVHDFVFIDYDNFEGSEAELRRDSSKWDFEDVAQRNISLLVNAVCNGEPNELSSSSLRYAYDVERKEIDAFVEST